jgi:predicted Zn-dependent protease
MPDPSSRRAWSLYATLLCIALAVPVTPVADSLPPLPDFGDASGNLLTPAAERRLGQAFMRSVRASTPVIDDPLLDDYLNDLGRRLTQHTALGTDSFHFFFVDDPSVNAFAGPAGHIGIHTGLVLTSDSESELAAVMAHEIAHVTQQHLVRTWQAASDMTVPQAAVLIAAVVLGAAVGADAGMAAAMGGQAAMLQRQINFTRAHEQEADRVGIELLANAGFDPRAMASFFTRMGRATRDQNIQLPEFLRTHPITTNRIAEAMDRANAMPYRQPGDDLRYQLLRERLRVKQQASATAAANDMQRALEDGRYRNRDAARYGLALALAADRRPSEGLAILSELRSSRPAVLEYLAAAARLTADTGDYKAALAMLDSASPSNRHGLPVQLLRAELLLEAGEPKQAATLLETLQASYPADPRLHALLARAYGRLQKDFQAHEHLANAHFLRGNPQAAVQQLEIALRIPGVPFFDASRIESLLQEYRAELAAVRDSQ